MLNPARQAVGKDQAYNVVKILRVIGQEDRIRSTAKFSGTRNYDQATFSTQAIKSAPSRVPTTNSTSSSAKMNASAKNSAKPSTVPPNPSTSPSPKSSPLTSPSPTDCIRADLIPRFTALNLHTTHLPSGPSTPNIPILHSAHLPAAKRLILYFGESTQDLGIFAYRTIGQVSHAAGSCLEFVSAVHSSVPVEAAPLAVLIANCGQLIWYRRGARAVTQQTWNALPRKSGVSLPLRLDAGRNRVEGHRTVGEHVRSVFEWVRGEAGEGVRIDVVSVGDSVGEVVRYLESHWGEWKARVEAVAVGSGHAWLGPDRSQWSDEFADFWARRARAYLISEEPLDTPLTGRNEFGCNCYASGERVYVERTMPMAYKSMLTFFDMAANIPGYEEVEEPELASDDKEGVAHELTLDSQVVSSAA
ncbi:MAG: hypothetical protein Q9195_002681 [Heterodermia aff. obscurata]